MTNPTHRIVNIPNFSFEEWCKKKGISIPQEGNIAMAVMGKPGFTTKRTGGLQKKNIELLRNYKKLYAEYLGDLTYTRKAVPLDLTKEADQAYIRVMNKRLGA